MAGINNPNFTLTVNGIGFVNGSVVAISSTFNEPLSTTFISSTQLTAVMPGSYFTVAETFNIVVTNPAPGGGTSNAKVFTVNVANNPVPVITGIFPTEKLVGSGQFTLTVYGSNFVSGSVVKFNNSNRATTFVSSTKLTAIISATDITTAGIPSITVFNPLPGGGISNTVPFSVENPAPTILGISPSSVSVQADASDIVLTINGTGFVPTSRVYFNSLYHPITYINSGKLTFIMPGGQLANAATIEVSVYNSIPGGGSSNDIIFSIIPARLRIIKNTTGGNGSFDYTITGPESANIIITTTLGNGQEASDAIPGAYSIIETVPGGWTFNSVSCDKIFNAGVNGVTSVNVVAGQTTTCTFNNTKDIPELNIYTVDPDEVIGGSPDTEIIVTGSGFIPTSVVKLNSTKTLVTTFLSADKLKAVIPAVNLVSATTLILDVFNPLPLPSGKTTSQGATFTVTANDDEVITPTTTTSTPTTSLDIISLLQSLATAAVSGAMFLKIFKRG